MKNIRVASLLLVLGLLCFSAGALCAEEITANADDGNYKIEKGNVLNIKVDSEPELCGKFEVNEDGAILYPMLKYVKLSGLTKMEAQARMTELLKDGYLVSPYVDVSFDRMSGGSIMVLGCVAKPGMYDFKEGGLPTLLKAISKAGGFTRFADIGGTRVVRTTTGNKKKNIDPKINSIISGKKEDVELQADDLVMVPERLF